MKKLETNPMQEAPHDERENTPSKMLAKCPMNTGRAKKVDSDQSAHIKFKAEQQKLAESVAGRLRRQKDFPLPENFDERIEAEGWKYAEKMADKYLDWISTKTSRGVKAPSKRKAK
jgi:hypothetical protein